MDFKPLIPTLLQALGVAIAIAIMEGLSGFADMELARVPFATSIMLVLAAPDTEFAQPRNVFGGHIVCTICGLLATGFAGPGILASALGVFAACVAMKVTRTFHPPAGINPVICAMAGVGWWFLVSPVAVGAALLVIFALFWRKASDAALRLGK